MPSPSPSGTCGRRACGPDGSTKRGPANYRRPVAIPVRSVVSRARCTHLQWPPPTSLEPPLLTQILVVSDPPHGNVDAAALGGLLGLPTEDARLKLSYPAPEVLSSSDAARADEVARDMEEAGMSVVIVDAERLLDMPWAAPASWFEFGPEALVVRTGNNDVAIHDTARRFYAEPVTTPPLRRRFSRGRGRPQGRGVTGVDAPPRSVLPAGRPSATGHHRA